MIDFSPEIGFWSAFVFWFAVVNTVATVLFTIVVIIGGVFDLRYLFKALEEAPVDETDDGRVVPRGDGPKVSED
jgi:hypothetical protein